MNNENGFNNMGQPVPPTEIPGQTQPVTPIVDTPAPVVENPAPVVENPAPVVENPVPVTPVMPTEVPNPVQPVAPTVETPAPVAPVMPTETPGQVQPVTPTVEAPNGGGETPTPTQEPKKNNTLLIIIIAAVVLIGIGVGVFFILNGKDDNKNNENNNNQNQTTKDTSASDLFELAKKYESAVKKMWDEDKMVCQDAKDTTKNLKPSELSDKDGYEGDAYYYVFIDKDNSSEMKTGVEDNKSVSGWVRIKKSDGSTYVALSDGKNYIVEKGYRVDIPFSTLTDKDVVTTGNGSNYQYKNNEIFGSGTEDGTWGIGDISIREGEKDGVSYMSNGMKNGGYTPYCSNATE